MKKRSNKEKGNKFEKKVRRTIMSGGLPTDPLDLHFENYAVEVKYTDKASYRITLNLLEKIWNQAFSMQKQPYLVVGIPRNDREIFMLKINLSVERKEH